MKKKMYLAVLALALALTVTACGNNTGDGSNVKNEQTDKKKADTRLVSVKDLEKYVKLGEYKGITLDKVVSVISEDDLAAQIDENLMKAAEEISGGAEMGDLVTINFVGTKDGEAFDGGTANNYDLTLGAGGMIPGFEDGIVGMKKGETKDLNLTFPEDYHEPSFAGEDVVFKITCQKVRRKAELTDEWAAKQGDYKTADDYRAGIKAQMEEAARKAADEELKNSAWLQVVDSSEVLEYPQEDIEKQKKEYKKITQRFADQAEMELEEFVESQNMTMEQFEASMQQYAELIVKQDLVIQAILDAENISLNDEECLEIQDELIKNSGSKDLAEMIDRYGQEGVDEAIGLLRVEDFILKNAKINEKASGGDTTGENAEAVTSEETQEPDAEGEIDAELEDDSEAGDDTAVVE
ncbi:MAG: trigger factor [Eubacteriales bacterium]|nr:trigger factor [Eubacteriales bacterium]